MFYITINNERLPNGVKVKTKTLDISYDKSGKRAVLKFTLIDEFKNDRLYYFSSIIGKKVEVYEDGILIYGGYINSPSTRKINVKPQLSQEIICVDYTSILDRITVNKSYPRMKISEIVKDIIDNYLSEDGIWYDSTSIKETTNECSINCPYVFCSQVCDELVELIGWQWYIGPDKKFYFNDRTENGPSFHEYNNYLFESLSLDDNINEYRNKQVLKRVNAVTDELTETANLLQNVDRTYNVQFNINQKPKLYITTWYYRENPPNSDMIDSALIGISGIDNNMEWYWSKGTNQIIQDSTQEPIPLNKYLVVKYYGQYELDIIEEDEDAINERKSIEGGSGIYENIASGDGIEGITIADEKANALLNKYSKIAKKIKFSTYRDLKYKIGQICDVTMPTFEIDSKISEGNGYLVEGLKIKDTGYKLLRTVTLIDGEAIGGWIDFFKEWMSKGSDFVIRENALVTIDIPVNESYEWSGTVVIKKFTCLFPSNALFPSNILFPGTLVSTHTNYD